MKTTAEWNQEILQIKSQIDKEYPELSKYIKEMAVNVSQTTSDNDEINTKNLAAYHHKLKEMMDNYSKSQTIIDANDASAENLPGYPHYPASEDIYKQDKEEADINPSDPTKKKTPNENPDSTNEKSFRQDHSGSDLDVPGAELDDQDESVGSEDEENNYYSLGGDKHNDLEEDNNK